MLRRIERRIGKFSWDVQVHKAGINVVLETKSPIVSGIGLEYSINYYIRNWITSELTDQQHANFRLPRSRIQFFAFLKFIVVHVDSLKKDVIVRVSDRYISEDRYGVKANHPNAHYVVSIDCIVKNFDIACRHNENAGSCRR